MSEVTSRKWYYYPLPVGALRVDGRDRDRFLQGQLTNDVTAAELGIAQHTCLLNNTGHLLVDLTLVRCSDFTLLITDIDRTLVLKGALERFVVRERVECSDVTDRTSLIVFEADVDEVELNSVISSVIPDASLAFQRNSFFESSAFAVVLPTELLNNVLNDLGQKIGLVHLSVDQINIRRVELGLPKWGAELDEGVIPLEAGMEDAISYTKGCYMGQEIIARIHSRGHTNRTLVGLTGNAEFLIGSEIVADSGSWDGRVVGRVTSAAHSQTFGRIALAMIRSEYEAPGTLLKLPTGAAAVSQLPFGTVSTT